MGASKRLFMEQREALQLKNGYYEAGYFQWLCRWYSSDVQDNEGRAVLKEQVSQPSRGASGSVPPVLGETDEHQDDTGLHDG